MRTDDPAFLAVQNRLRYGQCTIKDHKLLSTRVIDHRSCPVKSLDEIEWREAPILVFRNDLRTKLNNLAIISKAREIGETPVVCVAQDKFNADSVVNEKLREYILRLPDNKTKGLSGYLFLVIGKLLLLNISRLPLFLFLDRLGMPLLLTANLATELRLSNGTVGTLRKLVYEDELNNEASTAPTTCDFPPDTMFVRRPLYALVEIQKSNISSILDTLPQKLVPIALVEETFQVECKELLPERERRKNVVKTKVKVTRKQFPFVPAYSITTYKSQGQTIPKIVVDLVFPPGCKPQVAAAYVPISRVKKLDDLILLRSFPLSALRVNPNQDLLEELDRLDQLDKITKRRFESRV
ncbi:unnamed protein product [Didymodactylos carnosus]|nr:unnamed protein product [Didymodactylos carnosus]CAF4406598.1 unnamed protein product [Didymodactylos carnosus]